MFQREDTAFYAGDTQLGGGGVTEADPAEMRLRVSKGDRGRKGTVVVRTKTGIGDFRRRRQRVVLGLSIRGSSSLGLWEGWGAKHY